jgi:hypothetical protein
MGRKGAVPAAFQRQVGVEQRHLVHAQARLRAGAKTGYLDRAAARAKRIHGDLHGAAGFAAVDGDAVVGRGKTDRVEFDRADVGATIADARSPALIHGVWLGKGGVAAVERRAVGARPHGQGRPAVVSQRVQTKIGTGGGVAAGAVAVQVELVGSHRAQAVATRVASHHRVVQGHTAGSLGNAATAPSRGRGAGNTAKSWLPRDAIAKGA